LSRAAELDSVRYDNVAIGLHWVIAVLVATLLLLGSYMTDLPRNTPERAYFLNLHKSLGVLTLALVVVRVAWRLTHRPPPLPATLPVWQQRMARVSHRLLYAVMLLQPLTGYVMSSFGEYGIRFFGVPLPTFGSPDPQLRELFLTAHQTIAVALLSLIVVHVLAAARHGVYARDGVVRRILPHRTPRRRSADRNEQDG
jgi:cytochrome b561